MISVILCTHNPRDSYISRTLEALRGQSLDLTAWELMLVDNASTPPLEGRIDVGWHPAGRIVREEDLGLTPARLRGIREARGEVLVFVDDDNVLSSDYLENVRAVAEEHDFLGAWSGSVGAEFDEPPAVWTRRYWGNLVIRDVKRDRWSNMYACDETMPLGAGLCVRRVAAAEYLRLHDSGQRRMLLDRAGGNLASGGDNDLAQCALDVGLGCGVMSGLRLTHLIPSERLTEAYLLRLVEGISYSSRILESYRPQLRGEAKPRSLVGRTADFLRTVRMTPRERRFHRAAAAGAARAARDLA